MSAQQEIPAEILSTTDRQALMKKMYDIEEKMQSVSASYAALQDQHANLTRRIQGKVPQARVAKKTTTKKPTATTFDGETDHVILACKAWNKFVQRREDRSKQRPILTGKTTLRDIAIGNKLQALRQDIKRGKPLALLRRDYIVKHMKHTPTTEYVMSINLNRQSRQHDDDEEPEAPPKRQRLSLQFDTYLEKRLEQLDNTLADLNDDTDNVVKHGQELADQIEQNTI